MADKNTYAPGGRLAPDQVRTVRWLGVDAAERLGVPVSRRHLLRIAKGESWPEGWVPTRSAAGLQTKPCRICGTVFKRRFPSGRMRSDRLWQQKETCSHSCNNRLAWAKGVFSDRAKRQRAKKTLPCTLTTH